MNLKILSLLAGGLVIAGGATTGIVISKKSSDTQESNEKAEETLLTPKESKDGESQYQPLGSENSVKPEISGSVEGDQGSASPASKDQQLQDSQQKATISPQSDVSDSEPHK